MKRQATGPDRFKHMINDRFAAQQGLQLVHTAARRGKAFATAGGQNNHNGSPRITLHGYTLAMTRTTHPNQAIADLRKSYERAELNEEASNTDPLKQFEQWLNEAIAGEVPEPNAMTLAPVGSNLRPSTRVVLIKGYDERGIDWYTNYDSRKGQELAGNPFAALQFHWVELERTVRIEGRERVSAWASPQSQVIPSRTVLVTNAAKYGAQFMLNPPRPPHWG
eukprot:gene11516-14067_t